MLTMSLICNVVVFATAGLREKDRLSRICLFVMAAANVMLVVGANLHGSR